MQIFLLINLNTSYDTVSESPVGPIDIFPCSKSKNFNILKLQGSKIFINTIYVNSSK